MSVHHDDRANVEHILQPLLHGITALSSTIGEQIAQVGPYLSAATAIHPTGVGKSSFIAMKFAATLRSLRYPAQYLNPVDALHGDIGSVRHSDVVVLFSKSGETRELLRLLDVVEACGCRTVAVTARPQSTLAQRANHLLYTPVPAEMDASDVVPTTSTTIALIVADILALTMLAGEGNAVERFVTSHPHGMIGVGMSRTVADVMHGGDRIPKVWSHTTMAETLLVMSTAALGIVCIVDADERLLGIITDGDVRRLVASGVSVLDQPVATVMTREPVVVQPDVRLHEALLRMEQRERQLSVLPVVNERGTCLGVVRLHDIVRSQL